MSLQQKDAKTELVHALPTNEDAIENEEDLFKGSWLEKKVLEERPPPLVDVDDDDDYEDDDDEDDE